MSMFIRFLLTNHEIYLKIIKIHWKMGPWPFLIKRKTKKKERKKREKERKIKKNERFLACR